jgi:hypothetical protein
VSSVLSAEGSRGRQQRRQQRRAKLAQTGMRCEEEQQRERRRRACWKKLASPSLSVGGRGLPVCRVLLAGARATLARCRRCWRWRADWRAALQDQCRGRQRAAEKSDRASGRVRLDGACEGGVEGGDGRFGWAWTRFLGADGVTRYSLGLALSSLRRLGADSSRNVTTAHANTT